MWSFDDIFLFNKVVEIGSFLNTAKLLNINQSTISRRIKGLEESLGITLIRRNTKHLEITDRGMAIYELSKNISGNLYEKIQALSSKGSFVNGILHVAIPSMLGEQLIIPKLPKFLNKYPDLKLYIHFQNKEIDLVKSGVDLAIISHVSKYQNQKIKLIYSSEPILVCTPEYINKYGMPKDIVELANHRILGFMLEDYIVPNSVRFVNKKTHEEFEFTTLQQLVVNNNYICRSIVYENDMIVHALESVFAEEIQQGKLVRVLPDYSLPIAKYYQIRHPNEDGQKVHVFIKFLEECFHESTM